MKWKLEILRERFSICKVKSCKGIDIEEKYVFVGSTDEEKSLICPEELVPGITEEREDGWRAFRLQGELDFSLIGILSEISSILAGEKVGIVAVSTYNTDYIFVKEHQLNRAITALQAEGAETAEL